MDRCIPLICQTDSLIMMRDVLYKHGPHYDSNGALMNEDDDAHIFSDGKSLLHPKQ